VTRPVLAEAPCAPHQHSCESNLIFSLRSLRQRIGTKLELQHLGLCPLAAFDVEGRPVAEGRPQTFALPTGIGIVDAPIQKTPRVASVDP